MDRTELVQRLHHAGGFRMNLPFAVLAMVFLSLAFAGCVQESYQVPDCIQASRWHGDQEAYWSGANETRAAWHRDQRHRFDHADDIGAACTWWNKTTPWGAP